MEKRYVKLDEEISKVIDELSLFVMYGTLREREIAKKAIELISQLSIKIKKDGIKYNVRDN